MNILGQIKAFFSKTEDSFTKVNFDREKKFQKEARRQFVKLRKKGLSIPIVSLL